MEAWLVNANANSSPIWFSGPFEPLRGSRRTLRVHCGSEREFTCRAGLPLMNLYLSISGSGFRSIASASASASTAAAAAAAVRMPTKEVQARQTLPSVSDCFGLFCGLFGGVASGRAGS